MHADVDDFKYQVDQFADLRILRYRIPGFEELSLPQKKLAYFLYKAALSGRDITYDQKYEHGLLIRRTLEAIDATCERDKAGPEWEAFATYLKRVWFSYGNHHHYSTKKFFPEFTKEDFAKFVACADPKALPLADGETPEQLRARLEPILFDATVAAQGVVLDPEQDMVVASSNNFYGHGITQQEVEAYYAAKKDPNDPHPVMPGLNSKLVKGEDGQLVERVWKIDGMYGAAIAEIVKWLEKASEVAENAEQKAAIDTLVHYYRTGDLKDFDTYSVAWVKDIHSRLDAVIGFIETYGDAMDMRATYEAMISLKDEEATKRIAAISSQAQWFEDHSSIPDAYKKPDVQGITAKVITIIVGAGDSSPSFPIGVNLPNSDWIRKEVGSKSVNLGNIVHSYVEAGKSSGILEEFAGSAEEIARAKAHNDLADLLHTDMHEVIGHASGRLKEGVATPTETLKNYSGILEEGRADLVALYFLMDPKLVEIGVMESLEVGKSGYDDYLRNALLVQLARVPLGEQLEESHMRNRAMVARWVLEKGAADHVVELVERDGKHYVQIHDYDKLRGLFGQLLSEVQRIKSEGDYEAGKALVEGYGVKVDPTLHAEVLARYKKLGIAPYAGFINPRLVPVMDGEEIVDVKVEYPDDFAAQMREYARDYGFLPTVN
ncbi:MAG: dihydrofolate reductase [Deltaproteobacteria bacterium]|nr:MAG: dihydrofolate reductase [Deltaproteobacteria bacterium]